MLSDLLLLIVDLLEVELVARVLFVLLMSNNDHPQDPQVCEDESSDEPPHRLLGVGLSEGNVAPEDECVHDVV